MSPLSCMLLFEQDRAPRYIVEVYAKLVHGVSMILTPLPNLSAMLVILGVQSLMLGLLAELVIRTYHESQNKKIYAVRALFRQEEAD